MDIMGEGQSKGRLWRATSCAQYAVKRKRNKLEEITMEMKESKGINVRVTVEFKGAGTPIFFTNAWFFPHKLPVYFCLLLIMDLLHQEEFF